MSVFLRENRKNSLEAGGFAPRPPVMARLYQILGVTQTLHIIFACYCCVDGTKMKVTN